jgi:hypothetical protein
MPQAGYSLVEQRRPHIPGLSEGPLSRLPHPLKQCGVGAIRRRDWLLPSPRIFRLGGLPRPPDITQPAGWGGHYDDTSPSALTGLPRATTRSLGAAITSSVSARYVVSAGRAMGPSRSTRSAGMQAGGGEAELD